MKSTKQILKKIIKKQKRKEKVKKPCVQKTNI
jgi:hypothetical protein